MDLSNQYLSLIYFSAIIVFFLLPLRLFYFKNKPNTQTDTYGHYNLVRDIRNNKHSIPFRLKQYSFSTLTYPWLLHFIYSFLSDRNINKFDKYSGFLIDVIQLILLQQLTYYFTDNVAISLLIPLIMIFSPSWSPLVRGNSFMSFPIREFGELLIFSFFTSVIFYKIFNLGLLYVASIIIFGIILLSHRFATQVALFSIILASLIVDTFLFFIPFGGFIFAFTISRGKYYSILKGHLGGLYWIKKFQKRHPTFVKGSETIHLFQYFFDFKKLKNNRVAKGLFHSPHFLVTILLLTGDYKFSEYQDLELLLIVLSFSQVFLMFATGIYHRPFFGPPNRYMKFSLFPLLLLLSIFMSNEVPYSYETFLLILFTSIVITLRGITRTTKPSFNSEDDRFSFFLKLRELNDAKCISLPLNFAHELIYKTKLNLLFYFGVVKIEEVDEIVKMCSIFPYPDLTHCLSKYELEYVIIDLEKFNFFKNNNSQINFNFKNLETCFENKFFKVLKINNG
jgi:hypothetical protein